MNNYEKEILGVILAEMDMRNSEYLSEMDIPQEEIEEIERKQQEVEDVIFLYDIKKFENNEELITKCVDEMKKGLLKEGINSFENIDSVKGMKIIDVFNDYVRPVYSEYFK